MSTPDQVAKGLHNAAAMLKGKEPITRVTLIALKHVKIAAPVRRNTLRGSLTPRIDSPRQGRVGSNVEHMRFVVKGTGIYGPKKQRIVPKTKKALFWKGARHPVRSIKGQRPNDFLTRGLDNARPEINQELGILGSDILGEVS